VHLWSVWQDYARLSRYRPAGMSGGAFISFDTLDRYAARFGPHCPARFRRWCELIAVLDQVMLARRD